MFTAATGSDAVLDDGGSRHPDPTVASILATQEAYTWLEEAAYPTIAAVHGYAFGAGLQLALACDLRVVARGTKLGLLEHQYGILPDLGGTQRLPRLVGPAKALQLITTAARIDAEEAERIGLADAGRRRRGARGPPPARSPTPSPRSRRWRCGAPSGRCGPPDRACSVRDGLVVEAEAQAPCLRSDDMREAITAFVEGRPPVYRGV